MTKEDIITAAIHEAFRCGKEAGEESQRMWRDMQDKIDAAKQGKPDRDLHLYDGIFGMQSNHSYRIKVDPESAPNPDSLEEVSFDIEAHPGQRIGDTPDEQIAMLTHQLCLQKQENVSLRARLDERYRELRGWANDHTELIRLLKEKDATITELRDELRLYIEKATVPVGSPTGESPHTITTFHVGDQVVISKAFFDEKEGPDLHGFILSLLGDSCVVLIDEEDSIYDDVEFVITNEFITKA